MPYIQRGPYLICVRLLFMFGLAGLHVVRTWFILGLVVLHLACAVLMLAAVFFFYFDADGLHFVPVLCNLA